MYAYFSCYLEYGYLSSDEETNCKPNGYIQWTLATENKSYFIANTTAEIRMYEIKSNLTLLSLISNPVFLTEHQRYVSKLESLNYFSYFKFID